MSDEASIYKLVGPVLLKQDTSEAKSTVEGRLEFIDKEMFVFPTPSRGSLMMILIRMANNGHSTRIEDSIKAIQDKSEGKKMEVKYTPSHSATIDQALIDSYNRLCRSSRRCSSNKAVLQLLRRRLGIV